MDGYKLSIGSAAKLLRGREISSKELTQSVLDRIAAVDGKIGAYLTLCRDEALAQAEEADRRLARPDAPPLCGIPLAIKDVLCTKGVRTTCGSKILENFIPPYDAHVISLLKDQGAVLVGKTNMDEFAMGSSTENSAYFPTRNPWDTARIPGGSSGGSAAAVAADMCLAALGSDTGGSVRQPASHCGVVGIKPTYGRVSRFGLVAYASSLDQVGVMAKDVSDCALLLQAIAGHDRRDSTSANVPVPAYSAAGPATLRGLRIGVVEDYVKTEGIDPDVSRAFDSTVAALTAQGAEVVSVRLPHARHAVSAYYIIAPAEASSNLARYDGVKYGYRAPDSGDLLDMYFDTRSRGFGDEVKRRILIGTYALSSGYYDAYYRKASQVRTLLCRDFTEAFSLCDLVVSPVAPTPAFHLGEKTEDPLTMYLSDIFTLSVNLAGLPGISVPCGFSSQGLPIGFQIIGDYFAEEKILGLARSLEAILGIAGMRPEL
ncbi:MAG: Asp-tRNA(Asn)/Glu-tRNA(Gln) amidotransferase subunit GatA [Thermodesulfobacteriota bacterium]